MAGNSDIKANSVQLLLQLPTGTELGKNHRCFFSGVGVFGGESHDIFLEAEPL